MAAEGATKPGSDYTAPAEEIPESIAVAIDAAGSLESAPGEIQPAAGDALIEVGPATDPEQPAPVAEALAQGDGVAPAAESGVDQEANAGEAIPVPPVSAEEDADQPTVEAGDKLAVDETAPAEVDTTTSACSVDPAASCESTAVAEVGDVEHATSDAPIDVGPESGPERHVPAAQASVEDSTAWPVVEPGTIKEETNAAKAIPTSAESARVSAEQMADETATELANGDTAAGTTMESAVGSIDAPRSLDSTQALEPGDIQRAAGHPSIDAGPETDSEQSAPMAESLVGGAGVSPTADCGTVEKEANAAKAIPLPAVAAEENAEQPVVEEENNVAVDGTTRAEEDIATPAFSLVRRPL